MGRIVQSFFEPLKPHPLCERAKTLGVPLQELRRALGDRHSETKISRMLLNVDYMPVWVEIEIENYLNLVEYGPEYEETPDEIADILWKEIS
jgi:hypothetical protein